MVEHPAVNRNVVGSSPTFGATSPSACHRQRLPRLLASPLVAHNPPHGCPGRVQNQMGQGDGQGNLRLRRALPPPLPDAAAADGAGSEFFCFQKHVVKGTELFGVAEPDEEGNPASAALPTCGSAVVSAGITSACTSSTTRLFASSSAIARPSSIRRSTAPVRLPRGEFRRRRLLAASLRRNLAAGSGADEPARGGAGRRVEGRRRRAGSPAYSIACPHTSASNGRSDGAGAGFGWQAAERVSGIGATARRGRWRRGRRPSLCTWG